MSCGVPIVSFDEGDVKKWIDLDSYSSFIGNRIIDKMADEDEKLLSIDIPRDESQC